ncbi:hypothetical protein CAPTEDRAFT_196013 [Capitella teleta]|uniref:Small monomeric GTPase n=1 Tax=Capitella teleta TaxID=283909 RepID=R7VAN2_CAPTE|nr:hypothetical protein CAPTEDRAFT_196013 [Capitella teleta]|eukprot:ELU15903.1 hypothetical protein CAPTEDRAFT_196013 [Capitella teleta]
MIKIVADQINCLFVGDSMVGKTSLMSVLANKRFPGKDVRPTVNATAYNMDVTVDNKPAFLQLYDTAGSEGYNREREMLYPYVDVIAIVFSEASNRASGISDSLENIAEKWVPEIRQHSSCVPFILVGNKTDLAVSSGYQSYGEDYVRKLGAVKLVKCSALKQHGLSEVLEAIVRAMREKSDGDAVATKKESKCCVS